MRGKGRGWRGRDNKQINNGIILIFSAIKEIREVVLENNSRCYPERVLGVASRGGDIQAWTDWMRRNKDAKSRAEKLVSISIPLTMPSLGLTLCAHLRDVHFNACSLNREGCT